MIKTIVLLLLCNVCFSSVIVRVKKNSNVTHKARFKTSTGAQEWITQNKKKINSTHDSFGLGYTIEIEDITAKEIAEKEIEDSRKSEIELIKSALDKIETSDKPLWEKRLLKRLAKELGQ